MSTEDKILEEYLEARPLVFPDKELASRIYSMAQKIPQRQKLRLLPSISFTEGFSDLMSLLLIPRPAIACALVMVTGMYMGASVFEGDFMLDSTNVFELYFDYQGGLI